MATSFAGYERAPLHLRGTLKDRVYRKTSICNEKRVDWVQIVSASQTKPFTVPCVDMLNRIHWSERCGPGPTANWNSGEHCAACRHAKLSVG